MHPPSWLVVLVGQQKRSQKLGDIFADKSCRDCLISKMHHIVYSSHVLACNSDTVLTLSLTRQQLAMPLPSATVAQSVRAKLGLGQIS